MDSIWFVGTGNPNEKTAKIYAVDHLLMTSNRAIMADIPKFRTMCSENQNRPRFSIEKSYNHLLVCPTFYARKNRMAY